MEKKDFKRGALLRAIPLVVTIVVILVVKFASLAPKDWVGWYALYALLIVSLGYVAFFVAKHGKTLLINGLRDKMQLNAAKDFLTKWDEPMNKENALNYIVNSELTPDISLAFHEDDITVSEIERDENSQVTGEVKEQVLTYDNLTSLNVTEIGQVGAVHMLLGFVNGQSFNIYFDNDIAKFLAEKTKLELVGIQRLRDFYTDFVALKSK